MTASPFEMFIIILLSLNLQMSRDLELSRGISGFGCISFHKKGFSSDIAWFWYLHIFLDTWIPGFRLYGERVPGKYFWKQNNFFGISKCKMIIFDYLNTGFSGYPYNIPGFGGVSWKVKKSILKSILIFIIIVQIHE